MLAYLTFGATFGFAAAIQPGPFSTYIISETLSKGWRRTLPVVFSPLISDSLVVLLTLAVLIRVPAGFVQWLRLLGGVFVLYLSYDAWKSWRTYSEKKDYGTQTTRQTVLRATVTNLLNPNPYLGWSLVLGPLMLKGWRETPSHGIALVAAFYVSIIATYCCVILLFHAARGAGPKVNRALIGLSAAALACFGLYQLWMGIR
jgi:threonine/homoserine/homoserine lactone efflux protein